MTVSYRCGEMYCWYFVGRMIDTMMRCYVIGIVMIVYMLRKCYVIVLLLRERRDYSVETGLVKQGRERDEKQGTAHDVYTVF